MLNRVETRRRRSTLLPPAAAAAAAALLLSSPLRSPIVVAASASAFAFRGFRRGRTTTRPTRTIARRDDDGGGVLLLPPLAASASSAAAPASVAPPATTIAEDGLYYSSGAATSPSSPSVVDSSSAVPGRVTLTRYLSSVVQDDPELRDMESLLLSVQMACKTISNLVNRAGINHLSSSPSSGTTTTRPYLDVRMNSMKKLDSLSTNVLKNALRFTGKLHVISPARNAAPAGSNDDSGPAEHQPGVLIAKALDSRYVACFDPLDGSGNADAAICTGTVFGVFETPEDPDEGAANGRRGEDAVPPTSVDDMSEALVDAVLQPGKNLRAAGYCLYSSATILVFTLGDGTHGFTLDPQINEFVLTHPNVRIPPRGNVYSCNEANSEGWDEDLKRYLKALKLGENQTGRRYALRYVGSMVGDIHRTLMYGGIFCYPADDDVHPRGNLQLLYKSAPMGYVVEQAGGKSTNGKRSLLDVTPGRVHERSPCFIGSPEDIDEMKTYVKHEE